MAGQFDLKFYAGSHDVDILSQSFTSRFLPLGIYAYPFPDFVEVSGMNISMDNNFSFSLNIQNSNFIPDFNNPEAWQVMYLISNSVISGKNITVTTTVGAKTFGVETNYQNYSFEFSYSGTAKAGTFKGLTARRVIYDEDVHVYYTVAFLGSIARYHYNADSSPTTIPSEATQVFVDFNILDMTKSPAYSNHYYCLSDDDKIFLVGMTQGDVVQINISELNFSNITSITSDSNYLFIAGTQDAETKWGVYRITNGATSVIASPFSDKTVIFNRIGFEYCILHGGHPYFICSNGEGVATADINTSDPNAPTFNFNVINIPHNNIVNDLSRMGNTGGDYPDALVAATPTGVSFGFLVSPTSYSEQQIYNNNVYVYGVKNIFHTVIDGFGLYGSGFISATENGFTSIYRPEALDPQAVQHFDLDYPALCVDGASFRSGTDQYWVGATKGSGVYTSRSPNAAANRTLTHLSANYDLTLQDLIKVDVNTYYYLINEVASSDIDSNSILIKYDYKLKATTIGAPGYGIPTNRLWLVGDSFVLRNSSNPASFFYKNTNNLDLDELNTASESEGLINTTYAGNIVDLIYDKDIFYLVGTRGIEVWQNQGASAFPYRKQEFQSIPYHLSPLSDEDIPSIPTRYWDYYDEHFFIICFSNRNLDFDIIKIKDGSYSVLQINKGLFYKIINDPPSQIQDYSINIVNLWGDIYILIGIIQDATNVSSPVKYVVLDRKGKIVNEPSLTSSQIRSDFLQTTSTNGVKLMFDYSINQFKLFNAINLPETLAIQDPNFLFTAVSDILQPITGLASVKRVMIQYALPIKELSNYPNSTLTISYSDDNGRNFVQFHTESITSSKRQYVIDINKDMTSCIIKLECNCSIILMNSLLIYEESGLK